MFALRPALLRWDGRAADSADVYLTSSNAVRERITAIYGREADVIPPPYAADPDRSREPVTGLEPGFWLLVARLLPYKNVDVALHAFGQMPERRLVVVGRGPDAERLRRLAGPTVSFLHSVSDAQLRGLYARCAGLVAISHEDYGLTPLEAAAFGKPTVALRWGGYLDTVVEGRTGLFLDQPTPQALADGIQVAALTSFDPAVLRAHARTLSEARFAERLRQRVLESSQLAPSTK